MSLLTDLTARRDEALARLEQHAPATGLSTAWRFRCTYTHFVSFSAVLASGERVEARVYDRAAHAPYDSARNPTGIELTLVGA